MKSIRFANQNLTNSECFRIPAQEAPGGHQDSKDARRPPEGPKRPRNSQDMPRKGGLGPHRLFSFHACYGRRVQNCVKCGLTGHPGFFGFRAAPGARDTLRNGGGGLAPPTFVEEFSVPPGPPGTPPTPTLITGRCNSVMVSGSKTNLHILAQYDWPILRSSFGPGPIFD